MQNNFLAQLKKILANRHRKRVWLRIVSGMMAIVVFCTTYALILPGITLERQTYCALEEHTHTEDCYGTSNNSQIKKLVCDAKSQAEFVIHTHDEMCYNNGELICDLDELEEHEHSDDCYFTNSELVCDKEETEGHTHSEECYQYSEGDLICDDASAEHEHDESCYEQVEELVCDMEETEGHTHDESCYTETEELVCEIPEAVEHKHSDGCYSGSIVMCGRPEIIKHQHTDECFENINIVGAEGKTLECGKEEHTNTEDCYKQNEEKSNGGGGGGASTEKATAVDGTTETTTTATGAVEETTTEGTTQAHDDLVFSYSDENVSGVISLPWSEELPDDLSCEAVQVTNEEEDYHQMVASVDDAVLEKQKKVENLYLYRLEWSAGEDTYVLPEGLTPTVQFTLINASDDEDIKLKGLVLNDKDPDEIDDTAQSSEEALNTMISRFSADTIDENITDIYTWRKQSTDVPLAKDIEIDAEYPYNMEEPVENQYGLELPDAIAPEEELGIYTDVDDDFDVVDLTDEAQIYEAEIVPCDTEDYSVSLPLSNTGIFAFAETSESEYSSYGYYKLVPSYTNYTEGGKYLLVAQNELRAIQGTGKPVTRTFQGNYYDSNNELKKFDFDCTGMQYDYRNIEVQRVATTLDPDEVNSTEYYRIVDPNDSDRPVTPDSELYNGCFWNVQYYNGRWFMTQDNMNVKIDETSSSPLSVLTPNNTLTFYDEVRGSYSPYIYFYQITAKTMIVRGYHYFNSYKNGELYEGHYYAGYGSLFSDADSVYEYPYYSYGNLYTYTGFLLFEYVDGNKNVVSDTDAVKKIEASTLGTGDTEEIEVKTKDKCSRFVDVSGAKSIEETWGSDKIMDGAQIKAKSDPASSQIEYELCMDDGKTDDTALYRKQSKNDGRLLSDKSVIYGDDDYGAIKSGDYGKGDFSVTLSALGQEWAVTENSDEQTPLDVVFIYDMSGSMRDFDDGVGPVRKWEASATAISAAMKDIYKANSKNRAGVVGFSNCGIDILPIGRYSADDDQIFTYTDNNYTDGHRTLQIADNLYDGYTTDFDDLSERQLSEYSGKSLNITGMWSATNTQWGIQQAYEMFRTADTQVYVPGLKKNIDRQPVIVLVTDGDPTFCTFNYMNPKEGPTYGTGLSEGIQGYYTILSANYFKNLTSLHYNRQACFYTIGMGVKPSGYGNYDEDIEYDTQWWYTYSYFPDHSYTRAVLDPTKENIEALSKYSDHWAKLSDEYREKYYASGSSEDFNYWYCYYYTDYYVSLMWKSTGNKLRTLLTHKDLDGNYVDPGTVMGHTTTQNTSKYPSLVPYDDYQCAYYDGLGYTENMIPGVENPYEDDYNYVDGAYFGQLTTEDLEAIFDGILEKVQLKSRYEFLLKTDSNVVITDPLGDGMEVKGEPVLRYFGKNYSVTRTESGGDDETIYTDYFWEQVVDRVENSDAKKDEPSVDISGIVARVSINKNTGEQVVTLTVPEDALPVFYPDLNKNFYYEELPVRLIYRVGLSEEEEQKLKDAYELNKYVYATYYTNKYADGEAGTVVKFTPDETDPYYAKLSGTATYNKEKNTTDTVAYNFSESYDEDTGEVTQLLGNNGVLNISKDDTITINVSKEWEADDKNHPDSVYVGLYVKGTKVDAKGDESEFSKLVDMAKLSESNNWKYTWSKLSREKTEDDGYTYNYDLFYVSEQVPDGYVAQYYDENHSATESEKMFFDMTDDAYKFCTSDINLVLVDENYEDENTSIVAASADDVVSDGAVAISPMSTSTDGMKIMTYAANATGGDVIIKNYTSYDLPNAGGSGNKVKYGTLTIMIAAVFIYILRKRRFLNGVE